MFYQVNPSKQFEMNWKRKITAKQSIKNQKNVESVKQLKVFFLFHFILCFKATGYRVQHIKVDFSNRIWFSSLFSFLLYFKIAWNTFEARLLIGQQDNCARKRDSLRIFDWSQTRFDRQRISIDSNNVDGWQNIKGQTDSGEAKKVALFHPASIYRHRNRHINVGMHKL